MTEKERVEMYQTWAKYRDTFGQEQDPMSDCFSILFAEINCR